MKILNIFKKANLKNTVTKKSNAQTLDKKQLEKVIGGAEPTKIGSIPIVGGILAGAN